MENGIMLRGQSDLKQWHSQLKTLATAEGAWDLLIGVERHLEEPEQPKEPKEIWTPRTASDDREGGEEQNRERPGVGVIAALEEVHGWDRQLDSYRRQLEKFQKQKNRISIARRLIEATVEPHLFGGIAVHSRDPHDVYCKVLQAAGGIARPFNLTMKQLLNVRRTDVASEPIVTYVDECQYLRATLAELHPERELCSASYFIAILIAGLPDEYDDFVERWELDAESFGSTSPDVGRFQHALVEEEKRLAKIKSDHGMNE